MIPDPTYGTLPCREQGRFYDANLSELVSGYHHINAATGIRDYEAHLWRTADGLYFTTGYRYFDSQKWLVPLRLREAYHFLLDAKENELAATLFADLPVFLSDAEKHPEIPMSIRVRPPNEGFEGPLVASLVWWSIHEQEELSPMGLYYAPLRGFFLGTSHSVDVYEFALSVKAIPDHSAKQWLCDAGVPELADHFILPGRIEDWAARAL